MRPKFRRHRTLGNDSIALRRPAVNTKMSGVKVEISAAWPAKDSVVVADAWVEPNPGLDGEWTIETDFALDVAPVFSVEAEDRPHGRPQFFKEPVELGIIA